MNIIVLNIKNTIITFLCLFFIISLLLFSNSNIEAAKQGLNLWANCVVPSLFPFFIGVELLYCTNLIEFLQKKCDKVMKTIFNLSGESVFPFVIGFISGYPTGAKIINNLRCDKKISKIEGEHLLACSNNSGPLFILGTVGISIFCSKKIGIILLITHILGALTVAFLFSFWKPKRTLFTINTQNKKSSSTLSATLVDSISKSVITILNIGGYIVLFSVLSSILEKTGFFSIIANIFSNFGIKQNTIISICNGLLELTNGIQKLSIIGTKDLSSLLVISSFLLGFGGISVAMQVYSCISKSDLSIKPYLVGKIMHGFFSALYTFIFLNLI